jgi:hypothetical protein
MTEIRTTREEIIEVLTKWDGGELTTEEVWKWANQRYWPGDTEYDDWESDGSAANEVLCLLDNLDMNLILPADVPIHLEFLRTPPGKFEEGFAKWQTAIEGIDWKKRGKQLRKDPIYWRFCQ